MIALVRLLKWRAAYTDSAEEGSERIAPFIMIAFYLGGLVLTF